MTKTLSLLVAPLALLPALAACGDNPRSTADAMSVSPSRAVVVAGDFADGSPGVLSTLDPVSFAVAQAVGPAMAVGSDPVLRRLGAELFVINRASGNNVTILDEQTFALKEQLGTGPGSNPQDAAANGDKVYVATLAGTGLSVLTRGSTAVTAITLPDDDPDHEPNCNSVFLVGPALYVSCGLLDENFQPRGPGKVYVVDTATNTVRPALTLTLSTPNPISLFEEVPLAAPHGGELLLPTATFDPTTFEVTGGCVERIVPSTIPSAPGCLVTNTDLGGYASRASIQSSAGTAITFFAVPTVFPSSELRAYDMPTAAFWAGALNAPTETIGDVAVCPTGEIVVADTTTNLNGLRVYNGATEVTAAVLPIGKPPKSTHGLVCY